MSHLDIPETRELRELAPSGRRHMCSGAANEVVTGLMDCSTELYGVATERGLSGTTANSAIPASVRGCCSWNGDPNLCIVNSSGTEFKIDSPGWSFYVGHPPGWSALMLALAKVTAVRHQLNGDSTHAVLR